MDLGAEEELSNFRGHEGDGPRRVLGEGTRWLQAGRHPQVCDPHCARLREQYVARLQIAVEYATLPCYRTGASPKDIEPIARYYALGDISKGN